ncbi:MAG: hypothetical protein ACW97Z_00010 [Candidatus Hodarchaeales archaeon]
MNGKTLVMVLKGELVTPFVTKNTYFSLLGCKSTIVNPRRRYYTKINASRPMYPYSYICYLGTVRVSIEHQSSAIITEKLNSLLQLTNIGKFQNEGLGEIRWIEGYIQNNRRQELQQPRRKKLRIRKGLPLDLTKEQQQLLKYALLHDFYHTSKHQSKIYQEPPLKDKTLVEQLRGHHEKTTDPIIEKFQYYDRLAASTTRKIRSPIIGRYNWYAKRRLQKIDFKELAKNIQEVAETNIWNFYRYIYNSKVLDMLNESMNYGHTTLRNHLVVIANLIVQDCDYDSNHRKMHTPSS